MVKKNASLSNVFSHKIDNFPSFPVEDDYLMDLMERLHAGRVSCSLCSESLDTEYSNIEQHVTSQHKFPMHRYLELFYQELEEEYKKEQQQKDKIQIQQGCQQQQEHEKQLKPLQSLSYDSSTQHEKRTKGTPPPRKQIQESFKKIRAKKVSVLLERLDEHVVAQYANSFKEDKDQKSSAIPSIEDLNVEEEYVDCEEEKENKCEEIKTDSLIEKLPPPEEALMGSKEMLEQFRIQCPWCDRRLESVAELRLHAPHCHYEGASKYNMRRFPQKEDQEETVFLLILQTPTTSW